MYKIKNSDGDKYLVEAKDLKETCLNGLIATGSAYNGICSNKGVKLNYIKGKSVQNFGGGGDFP